MNSIKIISVKAVETYKIEVLFNDGTQGVYDVGHLSGNGVFKEWDINRKFEKVFLDSTTGAITWPGEIDIDTIQVYCSIKGISPDYFLNSQQHATY
jgi:hypothetical protein